MDGVEDVTYTCRELYMKKYNKLKVNNSVHVGWMDDTISIRYLYQRGNTVLEFHLSQKHMICICVPPGLVENNNLIEKINLALKKPPHQIKHTSRGRLPRKHALQLSQAVRFTGKMLQFPLVTSFLIFPECVAVSPRFLLLSQERNAELSFP